MGIGLICGELARGLQQSVSPHRMLSTSPKSLPYQRAGLLCGLLSSFEFRSFHFEQAQKKIQAAQNVNHLFQRSFYNLKNDDYVGKFWADMKSLGKEKFCRETWHQKINLEHFDFYDQVEHLEIEVS